MEKLKLPSDYDYLDVSQENDEYIFRIKQIKDKPSALSSVPSALSIDIVAFQGVKKAKVKSEQRQRERCHTLYIINKRPTTQEHQRQTPSATKSSRQQGQHLVKMAEKEKRN
ncbi:hypothetical protein AVEN_135728-1 [Araneus ventricosus]|uniref:Uncharacterized protein n=1 Tax=Araneus ventricosus TaxID=182803 RepID=A0A4Y2Q5Y5_ARAVE|nr:hypothetical protein AVEN_135728-1 [Araneus ventricosus]